MSRKHWLIAFCLLAVTSAGPSLADRLPKSFETIAKAFAQDNDLELERGISTEAWIATLTDDDGFQLQVLITNRELTPLGPKQRELSRRDARYRKLEKLVRKEDLTVQNMLEFSDGTALVTAANKQNELQARPFDKDDKPIGLPSEPEPLPEALQVL